MISRLVSFALNQRFIVLMAALMLMVWGAYSFSKLPIDAYPDLSPPHVEIITQWPGHFASEEIERLISVHARSRDENEGFRRSNLRSISLYGLSMPEMVQYDIDPYFRARAGLRADGERRCQTALRRAFYRCSSQALIYRYVLVSPDKTPQRLKTIDLDP